MNRKFEEASQQFEEMLREAVRLSRTPVDVSRKADDVELDSHVWARISALIGEGTAEDAGRLPVDIRAYYLTRLFEWLTANDGPDAFVSYYRDLLHMVPEAYSVLGLAAAADAMDRLCWQRRPTGFSATRRRSLPRTNKPNSWR